MNRSQFISGVVVVLLLSIGCQPKTNEVVEKSINDLTMYFDDESFVSFYEKFHSDSIFQLDHIQFPLQGMPSIYSPERDTLPFYYQKSDWSFQKIVDLEKTGYTRRVEDLEFVIKEQLLDPKGYGFERRYVKKGDSWNMIYYSGFNPMHSVNE